MTTTKLDPEIAQLRERLERVYRVAEAAFEAILGDRIYTGELRDFPCPDCDGERAEPDDYQFRGRICESCNGRGRISLRQQAGVDLQLLRRED